MKSLTRRSFLKKSTLSILATVTLLKAKNIFSKNKTHNDITEGKIDYIAKNENLEACPTCEGSGWGMDPDRDVDYNDDDYIRYDICKSCSGEGEIPEKLANKLNQIPRKVKNEERAKRVMEEMRYIG